MLENRIEGRDRKDARKEDENLGGRQALLIDGLRLVAIGQVDKSKRGAVA
jgi:hypothetical protein